MIPVGRLSKFIVVVCAASGEFCAVIVDIANGLRITLPNATPIRSARLSDLSSRDRWREINWREINRIEARASKELAVEECICVGRSKREVKFEWCSEKHKLFNGVEDSLIVSRPQPTPRIVSCQ